MDINYKKIYDNYSLKLGVEDALSSEVTDYIIWLEDKIESMTHDAVLGEGWRDTKKELPGKRMWVWACWGNRKENVDGMEYVIEIVRGKEKRRFYWRGRLSPWEVLYWQPYYKPEPPAFA